MVMRNLSQVILVVEGPAGSGKSHLTSTLTFEKPELTHVTLDIPRPRNYEGGEGEVLAVIKDLWRMGFVLLHYPNPVILDRWGLSSFVYNCLRRNMDPTEDQFINFMGEAGHLLSGLVANLHTRGYLQTEEPVTLSVRYIINLPPVGVIEERRAKAGKHYPFSAQAEWDMYNWIVEFWPNYRSTLGPLFIVKDDHDITELL